MRKFAFAAAFLCSLLLFSGCDVTSMSSLSELTKPYAGVYECRALTLGGEDLLPKFRKLGLELGREDFVFSYLPRTGEEGRLSGKYEVSPDEISFRVFFAGREIVRTCRREKGVIYLDENLGGRLLHAEFALP